MAVFTPEQQLRILSDLVAIQSANDHELQVANYLAKLLGDHGITATVLPAEPDADHKQAEPDRANLVAEIGSGAPVLALSGHMDTVSVGDADAWTSDPFTVTERDGLLQGRGTTDMKAGLAAMVIAMIELKAQGLPRKGTLRLLASRAEEVGEYGAKELARAGYMRDADALVVGEPSGWNIIYTHKGSVDFRLRSQGTAAHSSMPEAGFNAIPPLMEVLVRAQQEFNARPASDPVLGELTFSTTVFHGGDQVNTIPDAAVAEVNVRTIPQFDNDEAIALLKGLVGEQNRRGARISLDPYMQEPVVQAPRDSLLVRLATKLGERISGVPIPVVGVAAVTDASSLLKGKGPDFPFMMFGPGNETMHTVNENIDKQMYLDFVQLYQRLFVEYLGQAG